MCNQAPASLPENRSRMCHIRDRQIGLVHLMALLDALSCADNARPFWAFVTLRTAHSRPEHVYTACDPQATWLAWVTH